MFIQIILCLFTVGYKTLSPQQVSGVDLFQLVRFASSTGKKERQWGYFQFDTFPIVQMDLFVKPNSVFDAMATMMLLELQINAH